MAVAWHEGSSLCVVCRRLQASLFVCLFCLFVCLFVCLLVCLLVCLFACLLVCLFACLFVRGLRREIGHKRAKLTAP